MLIDFNFKVVYREMIKCGLGSLYLQAIHIYLWNTIDREVFIHVIDYNMSWLKLYCPAYHQPDLVVISRGAWAYVSSGGRRPNVRYRPMTRISLLEHRMPKTRVSSLLGTSQGTRIWPHYMTTRSWKQWPLEVLLFLLTLASYLQLLTSVWDKHVTRPEEA